MTQGKEIPACAGMTIRGVVRHAVFVVKIFKFLREPAYPPQAKFVPSDAGARSAKVKADILSRSKHRG